MELDYWNAAIGAILHYGLTTINRTENANRKQPSCAAKCIRRVLYPESREDHRGESNKILRYRRGIPTVSTKINYNEACNIHRWRSTLSPVYLNKNTWRSNVLNIIRQEWDMKSEHLRNKETQFSLKTTKQDRRDDVIGHIKGRTMPNSATYINYPTFKEIAKLLLKRETDFPETYIRGKIQNTPVLHANTHAIAKVR